jgi:hypothetical protein
MDMDICNHRQPEPVAQFPQITEITAIQANNTRIQTMGIKVIVQDESLDASATVLTRSEQEGPAFPASAPAPPPETG